MWIRSFTGQLVYFDISKYNSEKELYCALWKIKYNKDISNDKTSFNQELISLIIS